MPAWTPDDLQILRLSVQVAACATLASLVPAIAIAALLARRRFWGHALVNALVHLPLVLPPVVTGYLLLRLLGTRGPIGGWLADTFGLVLAFRWTGAVVAAAVMGFPLMVRAIRTSIESVDPRLEEAAATLGAAPLWRLLTITLPLAAPGILAGGILGFAKSLGEFGATITFVSNIPGETQTLALAIYALTQTPGGEAGVWRLAALSVAVSLAALVAAEALARRTAVRR
jgi:molybdate transport system permease protein